MAAVTETSIPKDINTFLSFRGVEALREEREPNPDFHALHIKPGHRFSREKYIQDLKKDDLLDLSSAENLLMTQDLKAQISKKFPETLTDLDFKYGGLGGSSRLRGLLSRFINHHFPIPRDRSITDEDIVTTPGVYAALEQISYAIANPGDGILIGCPLYGGFTKGFTFSRSKVKVVAVEFESEGESIDPFSMDAIERYKNVMERSNDDGTVIKAVLLCNPHNPLGRCFPAEVLEGYIKFCCENKLHLISDEIYAMSHYEKKDPHAKKDVSFTSVLAIPRIHEHQDQLVHSLYGMSKDFCCSGVRLGAVITRAEAIRNIIMTNSFLSWVSSGADIMWSCILADSEFLVKFFKNNRSRLTDAYQFLTEKLDHHGFNYYKEGNAGLFIWIDLSYALQNPPPEGATDKAREKYISEKLEKAHRGIKLSSGRMYKTEKLGWFRMVFSRPHKDLSEAVNRLVHILGEPNSKR